MFKKFSTTLIEEPCTFNHYFRVDYECLVFQENFITHHFTSGLNRKTKNGRYINDFDLSLEM